MDLRLMGALLNAMGGGGDAGNVFPASDADDLGKGAQFIPGEVTQARRRGERVAFVQACGNQCCWNWQFASGKRTFHWYRPDYEALNGGPCTECGNTHTKGGSLGPNSLVTWRQQQDGTKARP